MQRTTLELSEIKGYFPFHRKCVVKTLILLTNCILLANSCNLNKAKKKGSIALGRQTKPETVYTRFIRWFKMENTSLFVFGLLQLTYNILSPYLPQGVDIVLSMDRTNWKLGSININILMIGVVLGNGKLLPLYFELLNKKGNSSQKERQDLMNAFQQLFGGILDKSVKSALVLVGDSPDSYRDHR